MPEVTCKNCTYVRRLDLDIVHGWCAAPAGRYHRNMAISVLVHAQRNCQLFKDINNVAQDTPAAQDRYRRFATEP